MSNFFSLNRRFVVRSDFSKVVHIAAANSFTTIVSGIAPVACAFNSRVLSSNITKVILRSLESDGIKVFKGR